MGVIDNFRNLAGGAGRRTVPVTLLEGEQELLRVNANRRPGSLRSVGGELVLTSDRVIFTPWNTRDISALEAWLLPRAGAPRGTKQLIDALQEHVDAAGTAAARGQVASVTAGAAASLTRPPTVIVATPEGQRTEYGVVSCLLSPNLFPANTRARDAFVAAAREASGGA